MTSPAAPHAGAPGRILPKPRVRNGVRLMGPMLDTGFTEQQFLLRSPEGQFCRLSPLLYRVVEAADGSRDTQAMAEFVSVAIGKQVSAENVEWLLEERLAWLVVTDEHAGAQEAAAAPPAARDPLLGLRFRKPFVSARAMRWASTPLQILFTAPAVLAVMAVGWVVNWWLWTGTTLSAAIDATLSHPFGALAAVGLFLLGTVFHEIGHATALRKGGGMPGVMGVGLYLAWPAFYTDVTDSYRLPRWSRVRVDLGGIYFNLIFGLLMCGLEVLTGFKPLLFVAILMQIEAIHQLLPLVRLDGYWILADILGVPDLFSHVKAHVEEMRKARGGKGGARALRRGPARAFSVYMVVVLPVMMIFLGALLVNAPRLIVGAFRAEGEWIGRIGNAATGGNEVEIVTAGIQGLLLMLGPAAIILSLGLFFGRSAKGLRKWGAGSLRRGALAAAASLAMLVALFFAWVPADVRAKVPDGIEWVTKAVGGTVDEVTNRDDPIIHPNPDVKSGPAGGAAPRRSAG